MFSRLVDVSSTASTPAIPMVSSPSAGTQDHPISTAQMDAVCLRRPPEDRSITANINMHGVRKAAKANSNSTSRQKAVFVKLLVDTQKLSKRSRRNKRDRSVRKTLKQANTLEVIHPDPYKHLPHEVIKSSVLFVYGGDRNNPRISPCLPRLRTTTGKSTKQNKPIRTISLSDSDLSSPNVHCERP